MNIKFPGSLARFRRQQPEPVIDLSTPEARNEYQGALAAKERAYQKALPTVDFSRPPTPPVVRRRGDGDPPPTFALTRKTTPPRPKPSQAVPDVWGP
ncbi:hypothetical protein ACFWP3_17035 [Streptomyces sp. NPDC058525]|uniref:hypothetical protein n=1 Tax=Streptomyces sp. NPDC058525 TaxID=3346538 RepID=UPI003650F74A